MTGEEWVALRQVQGNGNRPPVEAYPNQYLDTATVPYRVPCYRSLDVKHGGKFTPLGTRVAELIRFDNSGLLASRCGYCQELLSQGRCRCHNGPTANVDDWGIEIVPDAKRRRPTRRANV